MAKDKPLDRKVTTLSPVFLPWPEASSPTQVAPTPSLTHSLTYKTFTRNELILLAIYSDFCEVVPPQNGVTTRQNRSKKDTSLIQVKPMNDYLLKNTFYKKET